MSGVRHHFVTVGGRELHVREWGDRANPPVVLWHGLARTGSDFAPLAEALAGEYHLIAPDTIGRGLSQWAADPATEYCLAFMGTLAAGLLDHFGFDRARWVGTSMGGALGIHVTAGLLTGRISHLVANDIGPELPAQAIERILTYVSTPPAFATMGELEAYLRTVYKPYGPISDPEWNAMARSSTRRLPDGRVTLHYDPRITEQFRAHPTDYDQWEAWTAIDLPVLLLRGAQSDLLLEETATRMLAAQPRARLAVEPLAGHAPALNVPHQIAWIRDFLAG
ncbi:MAG: alpha/beta hydrolase [Azospirillaceae bacterium]